MKPVTKREFDKLVDEAARTEHNQWMRRGSFVPLSFLRSQARKRLGYEYSIKQEEKGDLK